MFMIALLYIAIALIGAALGIGILMAVQKSTGRSRAKTIVEDAQREAEVIMKDKLLEAREQELRIKTEAEKAANQRLSRVQSEEAKLKQRQSQLNQQQSENTKARNEIEQSRREIEAQSQALEVRGEELDRLRRSAQEALEHISGLSSEEAKEKLVESLKDEAKTAAAAYIHDIMDEAKMTANKEAKRIVVQSIQRLATETAIENSVTVFHIDSDEIKGRIMVARAVTSVHSRLRPALRLSSMTPPRPSCCRASTLCVAR